jgi:hypothetical protein
MNSLTLQVCQKLISSDKSIRQMSKKQLVAFCREVNSTGEFFISLNTSKPLMIQYLGDFVLNTLTKLKPTTFNGLADEAFRELAEVTGEAYSIELFSRLVVDCMCKVSGFDREGSLIEDVKTFYALAGVDFDTAPKDLPLAVIYIGVKNNIQYLQTIHGITSLHTRYFAVRDRLYSFREYDDSFFLQQADKDFLRAEVPRLINLYLSLATTDKYDFFLEDPLDGLTPIADYIDTFSEVFKADYVTFYPESREWNLAADGSYVSEREIKRSCPDSLTMFVGFWNKAEKDFDIKSIVARHKDKSRFPWLLNK